MASTGQPGHPSLPRCPSGQCTLPAWKGCANSRQTPPGGTGVGLVPPGSGPSPGWDSDWHSVLERSFLAQLDAGALRLPPR